VPSAVMEGMPPQVICFERADGLSFGVSGVVTRARGIRETLPELDPSSIPMAAPVAEEKVVYLLDPVGASRRSRALRTIDQVLRAAKQVVRMRHEAVELPYIPPFLCKHGGLVLSIGQFNQWVSDNLMMSGAVQLWPGSPVAEAVIEENKVVGVRLVDQGTDKSGAPDVGFTPGMEVRAKLTVIADGPVGPVGRQLDAQLGMPDGNHQSDWAVGMKVVVDLPESCTLEPGTVIHTLGYPEPEIFGFMYVYPGRIASLGLFVPSWFDSPVRTAYRYLQHWMLHPYLWRHLQGGTLRSWGAKTIQEAGKRGEPILAGDGFARIGEGSGSTNVLTNSGVDEAWTTGAILGESVLELLREGKPFTKESLEATYVSRRRRSWVESEGRIAEHARDGFQKGFIRGILGTALAGLTQGKLHLAGSPPGLNERVPSLQQHFRGKISEEEVAQIRQQCTAKGESLHDALMTRAGWPEIPFDGQLLVSHQDALLLGGKVQAPGGYADHVVFLYPHLCETCGVQLCAEICSGQAITPNPEGGAPLFDREKCVHCGACLWNCTKASKVNCEMGGIAFRAGAGGLHSSEN
ncbi:MAG: 4Fe-4S ferredoxin, partial [Candidatus Hydrogenedentes bacterium]|nr:4Fe-4S ferredoxin [Candidatus Hydrogenedentota bacterium]